MMKKFLIVFAILCLAVCAFIVNRVFALQNVTMKDSDYGLNMYSPAFHLLYEDLRDEVVKGKVEFVGYNSKMINVLESLESPKNRLSKNYYYKIIAKKTPAFKKKIENDIKQKFNERSSIIDTVEWTPANEREIILYSMVKKNVEFLSQFEILDPKAFDGSKGKFKYFGIKDNYDDVKHQMRPLYYKDRNSYAISLLTKTGDEIILYVANDIEFKKPVNAIWNNLERKIKAAHVESFDEGDKFFAPFININELISYDELSGKEIKGTDFMIKKAIESVEFNLDNKGATLKNEAILALETCAIKPYSEPRYFHFNKPFILFMKEKDSKYPYFMVKIKDTKYLVK